ncbi:MAG: methyltransferase domain-containing protein, partial [Aliifodinibius sp.]|nr:class I SAM-dependent methyltransferase [Candidatus Saccharibacteria bacterium]NIV16627.1 methyltransferase domain-containing protein [Fodinibius sp.]
DFQVLDFEKINTKSKFDLIFAVEAFCHANDPTSLIRRLSQMLRKGGRLIIFDGFVKDKAQPLTDENEMLAYKLLCWGFALKGFAKLRAVQRSAQRFGFTLERLMD